MKIIRLAAAAAGIMVMAAGPALSHSWYSRKSDPVYGTPCCGGGDCGQMVVTEGVLTAETTGYHVRLTAEQARRINPDAHAPVDAIVTWNRVQRSEDGNYHICLMGNYRDAARGGIYCLFVPDNS